MHDTKEQISNTANCDLLLEKSGWRQDFFCLPGAILPREIYQRVNTVCFERDNWFDPRNVRSVNKSRPFEWKMICRNWRGNAKNGGLEKKPFGMAKYFYYFSPVASLNVRFPSVQKMRKKDTEIFLPVSKPDGWKDFR